LLLQFFDTVGWLAGRASAYTNSISSCSKKFTCWEHNRD